MDPSSTPTRAATRAASRTGDAVAAAPSTPERGTRRRRGTRVLVGVVLVGAVAAATGYLWLRSTSAVSVQGDPCREVEPSVDASVRTSVAELREGICRTLDGLVAAWDEGDAEAYGAGFTPDATYVAFTGTVYQGRDDIVTGHRALFGGLLEGTRLSASYLDVRVTSETTAVVLARGDTYEGDTPPDEPSKVQTFTLVREPGGPWRVAGFHNTQRRPVMERVQFLMEPGSVPARER